MLFSAFVLVTFTACGPGVPKDMPKAIPCYVTITSGGAPIDKVKVILNSETGGATTVFGETDANGRANLVTLLAGHKADGAPEGTYKVTLALDVVLPNKTSAEMEAMTPAETKAWQAQAKIAEAESLKQVPTQYRTKDKTPVSVTVGTDSAGKELVKIDTKAK